MTTDADASQVAEIPPPPLAVEPGAIEILRVWVAPGHTQQSKLQMAWEDPGNWGLLLAGVARDVAAAYEQQGLDPQEAFERIYAVFESEFVPVTDADGEPVSPQ